MARRGKGSQASSEIRLSQLAASRDLRLGSRGESVAALQGYLLKYGYLVPEEIATIPSIAQRVAARKSQQLLDAYNELAAKAISSLRHTLEVPRGQFDERTSAAVRRLQLFHGLNPSGVVDGPTRALFKEARYDHHPDIPLYAVAAQWDHTDLTYQFENSTVKLPVAIARAVIQRAFQTWQNASTLTFREATVGERVDIRVKWARLDHGDGVPFDGPWGILAHGFFPPPRGKPPGDLHFDDDENWCDDPNCSVERKEGDLVTVAAHEIGHCLGLDHSRDQGALMYSQYRGPRRDQNNRDLAELGSDDVDGVRMLYP